MADDDLLALRGRQPWGPSKDYDSAPGASAGMPAVDGFSSLCDVMRAGRPISPGAPRSLEGAVLVGGRIEVGRRIGGGAMGTVYEAADEGRPIAIKVLNDIQEVQAYRLKTEFRTLCELIHPNVICVHELFREGVDWFFSMELVEGLPVHRHLEAQRLLAVDERAYETELRGVLAQLIDGIHCIHSAELVHRDLKPTNVLVTKEGRLVILDFGLVSQQVIGGIGQTVDNRVSGTFGYMSPEQLRGAPASASSDWYSFGALLHQLLSGQPPRSVGAFLRGSPELARPSSLSSDVPADLDELCVRLLAPEPRDRPSGEELLHLSRTFLPSGLQAHLPRSTTPKAEHFIGRELELEQLRAAFTDSLGQSAVVLLHGPGGTGKSFTLRHYVAELKSKQVFALENRCSEWESVPYNGFDGIIDSFSRLLLKMSKEQAAHLVPRHVDALVRLFPALLRVDAFREAAEANPRGPEQEIVTRRRAIASLKDVFFRLGERHQVAISIDDLQWVDADTLQLFVDLLAPPDTPKLLLLLALRTNDSGPERVVEQLSRSTQVRLIELGPLSMEQSRVLARELLARNGADDDPALVERAITEAAGIPLYLSELARELAISPERIHLASLKQVLLSAIETVSPAGRELLEIIAISFRPITLRMATHCNVADAQNALRQLMTQRLVRGRSQAGRDLGFEPYTDQVRQVVQQAMGDDRAAKLHAQLVSALETLPGVEPQWLLSHYRAAGSHKLAKTYSIIMAERALAVLAFDHAASMYLSALELTNEGSPDWITLNLSCADALTKAGRGAEAARAYLRATRGATPQQAQHFSNLAVTQWIRSGHLEHGVALLKSCLEAVGISWPESSTSAILRLIYGRIWTRMSSLGCETRAEAEVPPELLAKLDALGPAQTALGTFDYLRGAIFAAEALPLALKAREPRRLALALAAEATYAALLRGTSGEARVTEVHECLERVRTGMGNYEYGLSRMVAAMTTYWFGRWRAVIVPAREAEAVFRENIAGALWEANLTRSVRHTVQIHAGRFHELGDELPDELASALARDDQYTYLDLLRRNIALNLVRGETVQAEAALARIAELRARYAFMALDHLIMSATVATYLYMGDARRAQAEFDQRSAACATAGMNRLPLVRLTMIGMRADCAMGSDLPPLELAQRLRSLANAADKEKVVWASALSSRLRGSGLACEGRTALAGRELNVAAGAFDSAGLHVAATVARMRARAVADGDLPASDGADRPETILRAWGVACPERWARIVHTLY